MGFFHTQKNMTVTPAKQLTLFIQVPEEALRRLLHTASIFSTTLNAGPIAVCWLAPSLSHRHNINCPDCKIKQLSRCYLYDSDAACDYLKKKSDDYSEQDPTKKMWLVVSEKERRLAAEDYFALGLCSARLRWLTDNSCSSPCITGMQSVFVCTVSRCTVSDWIPRDALEWQFVIDMLD